MDESIEVVIEINNQDLILMKNEGILSQKGNQMSLINVIYENQMQENVNADGETMITLGEELQKGSKAKCTKEKETMLVENIVKGHQFIMMIGTMEIAMDVVEIVRKGERHLLKDVRKEEFYAKILAKGESTSDDLSITKEGMENCVIFPKSNPTEIIGLYRKLYSKRREIEKQRIYVQERLLKKEGKNIVVNDNHKKKEMDKKVQQIDTTKEGVHYSGQEQEDINRVDDVEERLVDSLMSSFENSTQHVDVFIEKKEIEKKTELFPKEDKAQNPYVFYFNKCFVSAGFVVDAEGNLAPMRSQIKMKEEYSVEEFNPWNIDTKFLERMLKSHYSMQTKIIMKEGKDEREEISIVRKEKVRTREKEEEKINQQLKRESNQQQFKELVDNNNNLGQREGGRSKKQNMDQSKDELEIKIEELWKLMVKQSRWRKMIATGRMINHSMNLIDKKKKMEQKTTNIQQQQRNKTFGQLQNKVWDPGRQISGYT